MALLSTHPGYAERSELAYEYARKAHRKGVLTILMTISWNDLEAEGSYFSNLDVL
jgi:hypothetical protein